MADQKLCHVCGKSNREQARFCGHCGQPFHEEKDFATATSSTSYTSPYHTVRRQDKAKIMPITREQLNLAGWCSVISAVVTIPMVIISLILTEDEGIVSWTVGAALTLTSLGLFVYVFGTFKKLLNSHFGFGDADTLISVLIWANVVGSVMSLLPLSEGGVAMALGLLQGLALIPFGIIFIVFAIKLLRLPDNLFGLLKPFSYTSIATGFCFATIFLIPLGLVASTIADMILAIIFFRFVGKVKLEVVAR